MAELEKNQGLGFWSSDSISPAHRSSFPDRDVSAHYDRIGAHLLSGFFSQKNHSVDQRIFRFRNPFATSPVTFAFTKKAGFTLKWVLIVFISVQLILPFRYLSYPGELFWTEEGYRFSWRVMLMEKAGYTTFKVSEMGSGRELHVDNTDFLTPLQEKQMSFQPDMILEFAHHLARHFERKGWKQPEVFAESYVALNGRPSQLFINPKINLAAEKESFKNKKWVLPFHDEIRGL